MVNVLKRIVKVAILTVCMPIIIFSVGICFVNGLYSLIPYIFKGKDVSEIVLYPLVLTAEIPYMIFKLLGI